MASRFFRADNPCNEVMSVVGDLAMLSLAWFVCSIPLVTIGASSAAACEVARTMQEGRDNGIFRGFWAAFTRRIGTALLLTLILASVWGVIVFDLWYLSRLSGDVVSVAYGITLSVIVLVGMILAFILPLSGRSGLGVAQQIKQSARLAAMKPLTALACFALNIAPIVLIVVLPGAVVWMPLLYIVFGIGGTAWLQMFLIRKAFALE